MVVTISYNIVWNQSSYFLLIPDLYIATRYFRQGHWSIFEDDLKVCIYNQYLAKLIAGIFKNLHG